MSGSIIRRIPGAVAEQLATYASKQRGGNPVRLLDASCADGEALRTLGRAWSALTFGAEPSRDAVTARYGTTKVVGETFLNVRISPRSVSAAIGVIPHDEASLARRDHAAFVQKLTDAVACGGLAAFVGPPKAFDRGVCATILHWYEPVRPFALPLLGDGSAVIVVAVKQWQKLSTGGQPAALVRRIRSTTLPPFGDADAPLLTLPAVTDSFQFGPQSIRYSDAAAEARTYGAWADPEVALLTPRDRTIQPVMPLRKGHVAEIVVGGFFDSVVVGETGGRLLVKGRTVKERTTTTDGPRTQEVERFRPVVTVMDVRTGEWRTLVGGERVD